MDDFNALRAALIKAVADHIPATNARGCYDHECAATEMRAIHTAYTAFMTAAIRAAVRGIGRDAAAHDDNMAAALRAESIKGDDR